MVTIRLARAGCKKRPFYHVVVTDSESPRDGSHIERVGYYDPRLEAGSTRLDLSRVDHWCALGAQVSDRVSKVIRDYKRNPQVRAGVAATETVAAVSEGAAA